MAREYARIRISIAGDDHLEELSPAAQWLYFRILIPDPQLSHCGVTRWLPKRLIHKAAGLTLDYILAAAAELERERFALFDDDTEEVLVRSYLRSEELLRNPKMAVAVADAYLSVASRQLKAAVATEVHRDKAEHPDYSSWTHAISREAVQQLLTVKTSDQIPYVATFANANGVRNGDAKQVTTTNQNGNQNPNPDRGHETQSEHQSEHQADSLHLVPTSLQPAHTSLGGYVGRERHQGAAPDPNAPNPVCARHPNGNPDDEPCNGCRSVKQAEARAALAAKADAEQAAAAQRESAAVARAMAIIECDECDDDGYRGGQVCAHNPGQADTNARGMAKMRAALAKDGEQ